MGATGVRRSGGAVRHMAYSKVCKINFSPEVNDVLQCIIYSIILSPVSMACERATIGDMN